MAELIDEIVTALDSRDDAKLRDLGDVPRYLAQYCSILRIGDQDVDQLRATNFPYIETFGAQAISSDDADRLKSALMAYAAGPSGTYTPAALWSLGYFFDTDLVDFLDLQLRRHLLDDEPNALGQCIIALDTIGVLTLPDGSFAAHDHARNRTIAKSYLEAAGKT